MLADATPAAEIIQKRPPNFRMLIYERRVPLLESSGDESIRVVHAELCMPAAFVHAFVRLRNPVASADRRSTRNFRKHLAIIAIAMAERALSARYSL